MKVIRRIPKRFTLFATKINVVIDNNRLKDHNTLGLSEYAKSLISIATETIHGEIPEDVIIDTYFHEKVHMILDTMGRDDLSKDEQFVEVFARLLRQAEESEEFETN